MRMSRCARYHARMKDTPAERILAIDNLISFWDFQESPGQPRVGRGPERNILLEGGGIVPTVEQGLFGKYSTRFGGGHYLHVPRSQLKRLDIHGHEAQVTIVAWLKRRHDQDGDFDRHCQAVAGVWNEHSKRQYAMFLNLRIHDSADQVGAHISGLGGPTPGHKYCMDAAIGATPVPFDQWHCCAITYDGLHARAYLDGRLDERGDRNPYDYHKGIFDGGADGGDFTVGAVPRPESVTDDFMETGSIIDNRFHGLLSGLAVFDRALKPKEIQAVSCVIALD